MEHLFDLLDRPHGAAWVNGAACIFWAVTALVVFQTGRFSFGPLRRPIMRSVNAKAFRLALGGCILVSLWAGAAAVLNLIF